MAERRSPLAALEREKPLGVEELFYIDDSTLPLKTETPARMVLPLVRMKVIEEACNPNRKKPLIKVFVEELDRRMISLDRKGRLELLAAVRAAMEAAESEEIVI